MEPLNNMIECPIDIEYKFHKADLLALKDTEYGCLNGKAFYAYNIPGVLCYLSMYPNGNNQQNHGQTWLFLRVNGSEERNITATFVTSIKSANYNSQSLNHVYQHFEGWGISCATSNEFFDSSKKFFVNGEITIKIKGILKTSRFPVMKISSPISMKWMIKESDLIPLKESNIGFLKSKRFIVSTFSDVKYCLYIYPNGINAEDRGKTWIFLNISIGNEKEIEAVYDFSIKSANYYCSSESLYENSGGKGYNCCSINDLFDSSKNFIVDGYLTINLNGILIVQKNQITTLKLTKGVATQAVYKKKNKEFTIVVDEKEIKVHKKVLSDASPVFAGMFESGMKEALENKMNITDFSFDIVEAAIKLCYSAGVRKISSIEDMFSLYKFADKYQIDLIMEHVIKIITKKMSPANVCQLIEFSQSMNVKKLHQKCVEFIVKCAKDSIPVYGANVLDQAMLAKILLKCLCPVAKTDI